MYEDQPDLARQPGGIGCGVPVNHLCPAVAGGGGMTKDKALDLALEALEELQPDDAYPYSLQSKAITAIKKARSAPVQEPVAWVRLEAWQSGAEWPDDCFTGIPADGLTPLYTTPTAAQRQWVGLTQKDIDIAFDDTQEGGGFDEFARAIEAKLKEKNGLHRQHVIDGSPCWCEPETSYTDPETGASVVVHKEPQ